MKSLTDLLEKWGIDAGPLHGTRTVARVGRGEKWHSTGGYSSCLDGKNVHTEERSWGDLKATTCSKCSYGDRSRTPDDVTLMYRHERLLRELDELDEHAELTNETRPVYVYQMLQQRWGMRHNRSSGEREALVEAFGEDGADKYIAAVDALYQRIDARLAAWNAAAQTGDVPDDANLRAEAAGNVARRVATSLHDRIDGGRSLLSEADVRVVNALTNGSGTADAVAEFVRSAEKDIESDPREWDGKGDFETDADGCRTAREWAQREWQHHARRLLGEFAERLRGELEKWESTADDIVVVRCCTPMRDTGGGVRALLEHSKPAGGGAVVVGGHSVVTARRCRRYVNQAAAPNGSHHGTVLGLWAGEVADGSMEIYEGLKDDESDPATVWASATTIAAK